jgi:hypothetical protein
MRILYFLGGIFFFLAGTIGVVGFDGNRSGTDFAGGVLALLVIFSISFLFFGFTFKKKKSN